jgi:hypothetical protein
MVVEVMFPLTSSTRVVFVHSAFSRVQKIGITGDAPLDHTDPERYVTPLRMFERCFSHLVSAWTQPGR